ncbi:MAG: redox-regulated ATPase YchF [Candidatus Peregrinibacteria bacterium]|nr:redox-regulated ATPase YchF [Candidatus Peregrinibacteria bacterium]MDZ4244438.1 redox-regulated ATPase YchF [Candidatus Gracilibacteria bacterium]
MKIGIVGLPNVGKSTIFNALTKSKAARAENFPFCTIDPNVGLVEVPDYRMKHLAEIVKPERVLPAVVEFVDIAGLVKGASEGEGLGNKFLANIRECEAIAQVVRYFEDDDVHHVHGNIDPKRDVEIIQTELILADLQTVEKRYGKASGDAKTGKKEAVVYLNLIERLKNHLESGGMACEVDLTEDEELEIRDLHLLTAKPIVYVVNVAEHEIAEFDISKARNVLGLPDHSRLVPISAKIEEDLMQLPEEDAQEFLKEYGLEEPGLNRLIREAYDTLGLHTYFTAGVKEVRAWTIPKGASAPQAAGKIHTDFEKGFIRAEVVAYNDYLAHKGEKGARDVGKLRSEGKSYIVADGDVMHFLTSN